MKSMKKRLVALVLVAAMCFTASMPAMARQEVGWKVNSDDNGTTMKLQVEKGETFYIGDLFSEYINNSSMYTYYSGSYLNASYKSNKTSVVSVNATTGKVNPKKTGTATITLKYGGKSYKAKIKVVKKGKVSTASTYKTVNSKAATVAKYYNTKITSKNFVKIAKAYYAFEKAADSVSTGSYGATYVSGSEYYNLVVPNYVRVQTVYQKLYTYATHGSMPKISKVSAKADSSKITVTLSSKLSQGQIARMSLRYSSYQDDENKLYTAHVKVPVYVLNKDGSAYAYGLATLNKGSKTISVSLKTSLYSGTEKKMTKGSYTLRIGTADSMGTSVSSSKSFKIS